MRQMKIHMLGICGTAMASLAGLFQQMGHTVTGSDENVYPPMSTQLQNLKIQVCNGYRPENIPSGVDLAVIGNVITAQNIEAQAVLAQQIPYISLPQAIGQYVIAERESLVVTGTHGKTTSTSLLSWVAQQCQLSPGYLIGGIPKNFTKSFELGRPPYFIIEGDEYDTAFFDKVPKFIHYKPKHVILTSIEFDHADIYVDLEAIKAAFLRLMRLIPPDGTLVFYKEDQNIWDCLEREKVTGSRDGNQPLRHPRGYQVIPYGLHSGFMHATGIQQSTTDGLKLSVVCGDQKILDVQSSLIGEYNIKNLLAVVGLAHKLGWPLSGISEGLRTFQGVKRRQEILGEPKGVLVIEDFAHHPTAVYETLRAVKSRYAGRPITAVFEARSATSRRKVFQTDYVRALSEADHVLIPPAFNQDKIAAGDRFSVEQLVSDLKAHSVDAYMLADVDKIVQHIAETARSGDVVLIMSNGGFGGIYEKLLSRLNA